jgi:hypothetical protein
MYLDCVNGLFESLGAFFTWRNAYSLYRDKEVRGVYWPTTAFFSAWGLWNLHYYPSLNQWFSFMGGAFLVGGNILWTILYLYYRGR